MSEFKKYHPIVNFLYFVFVIGFSCSIMHPFCMLISLLSGFAHSVMLKGRSAIKSNLLYMLPTLIVMALVNPAFNHEGITILCYLPDGNPLTFESIVYGCAAAVMIVSVICHFSCYNEIMTSDKFIYLFGRVIPAMSLIISMTLRFVPRFRVQLKNVVNAQRCIGRDIGSGSIIVRARYGLNILSIMTTWALENAVETADSMKSRGYGHSGRTAFSIFKFSRRDKNALLIIMISGLYTLVGSLCGGVYFRYFPSIKSTGFSVFFVSVLCAYFILCVVPLIIEIREVRRWKLLKSKI